MSIVEFLKRVGWEVEKDRRAKGRVVGMGDDNRDELLE